MNKIFLLNGPPRCGKDTAAVYLAEEFDGQVAKFAQPLKDGCTAIYCRGDKELFNHYDSPELKDENCAQFFGKSCRQAQIDMSESYLKVLHGNSIFGKILADKLGHSITAPIFVSDSGFEPEAMELINKFSPENVVLIRIHREGCNYTSDSRGYINIPHIDNYDIYNHGKLSSYLDAIKDVVSTYQ